MQKELDNIGPEHPDLRQWASFIIGSAAGDTVSGVTAYYGTKHNNESLNMTFSAAIGFAFLSLHISGNVITDKSGNTVATWDDDQGGFVDGYGKYLGDKYDDIVAWYKTKIPPITEIDTGIGSTVIVDNGTQPGINTGEGSNQDTQGETRYDNPYNPVNSDPVITTNWYKPDGSLTYPPNGGAISGTEVTKTIEAGQTLGRYGNISPSSDYVAPPGSAPESLSLLPYTDKTKYTEYEVLKPIPNVTQSTVAPWGDDPGLGVQFKLPMPIKDLIEQGYIKPKE